MPLLNPEFLVPIGNGELFCCSFGEKTSSPIIVLHGGPGLGKNYLLPQMAQLGKFAYAVFYDQRGTGNSKSKDNWQANPITTYVQDLEQLRLALQLKTISLLGHSWGAVLTAAYALAYPDCVDKLIYVNPVPLSSHDYLAFVKHRTEIVDKHKNELDKLRGSKAFIEGDPKTVEAFYRIYFKSYFAKPKLADTLSLAMTADAALNNFKTYELFYDYVQKHAFDFYDPLKKLNKPSLIIAGNKDIIPLTYQTKLHQSIPSSQLVVIENCGHFAYIDEPSILFKTIQEFINK